jgi:hypothetical protein
MTEFMAYCFCKQAKLVELDSSGKGPESHWHHIAIRGGKSDVLSSRDKNVSWSHPAASLETEAAEQFSV